LAQCVPLTRGTGACTRAAKSARGRQSRPCAWGRSRRRSGVGAQRSAARLCRARRAGRRESARVGCANRPDSSDRQRRPGRRTEVKAGKLTLTDLAAMKERDEKIVMVTAYDAPGARLAEEAGIDILLVGDTAAMVVLGHDSTVTVTMDEMLFLTRTVARTVERPLVVGDMPFGSY